MQIDSYKKEHAQTLIDDAQNIAVIPSKISGADAFTAGVGLYNMLLDKGKEATFIYTGKSPEEAPNIIDSSNIFSDISQRELIIEVDYDGTSADKVHYKTENNVLQFRLGPIPSNFNRTRVKSRIRSFDFDLIFVLGVQHLRDLGSVYDQLRSDFTKAKVINIDNTKKNTRFGVVNIVDAEASSLSMLVFNKAAEWGLSPNEKAAHALLRGITYRSERLSVK